MAPTRYELESLAAALESLEAQKKESNLRISEFRQAADKLKQIQLAEQKVLIGVQSELQKLKEEAASSEARIRLQDKTLDRLKAKKSKEEEAIKKLAEERTRLTKGRAAHRAKVAEQMDELNKILGYKATAYAFSSGQEEQAQLKAQVDELTCKVRMLDNELYLAERAEGFRAEDSGQALADAHTTGETTACSEAAEVEDVCLSAPNPPPVEIIYEKWTDRKTAYSLIKVELEKGIQAGQAAAGAVDDQNQAVAASILDMQTYVDELKATMPAKAN